MFKDFVKLFQLAVNYSGSPAVIFFFSLNQHTLPILCHVTCTDEEKAYGQKCHECKSTSN